MIEGVIIKDLRTHHDERGFFREIFRFPSEFSGIPVGQVSHSFVNEGVIKGWHGHKYQAQWNYVVTGKIKVVLFDNREDSVTFKELMEFYIGEYEESQAYYFPKGVLHGYQCLIAPMNIIYVTSGVFDLKDEERISLDNQSINYHW
jgi:dTDP-4-dehydrorhamnose 3,5-epimerase